MIKKYNFCILINQSKIFFKKPIIPVAWSKDAELKAELNKFYWEFVIIYKLLQYFLQIF